MEDLGEDSGSEEEDDSTSKVKKTIRKSIPKLVHSRSLSFSVSILLVLLRKYLLEREISGEGPRVIITREQIKSQLQTFLEPSINEARMMDKIDAYINGSIK